MFSMYQRSERSFMTYPSLDKTPFIYVSTDIVKVAGLKIKKSGMQFLHLLRLGLNQFILCILPLFNPQNNIFMEPVQFENKNKITFSNIFSNWGGNKFQIMAT